MKRTGDMSRARGSGGVIGKIRVFLGMIKFSHTVFALPFALMGALLAASGIPPLRTIVWILLAMVGARSGAMGFNRLVDADLDARNPRTRERALPRGLMTKGETALFIAASFGLFLFAAAQLNPLCFRLAPLAIAIVTLYSYTKRFTTLSHLILGVADALAPLGGWLAVSGRFETGALLLSAAVAFWVAGFDIFYSLADIEFDRTHGLYSYPAVFGIRGSLFLAASFHLFTLLGLVLLIPLLKLGTLYLVGVFASASLLLYEHLLILRYGLTRLNTAFFTVNGVISVLLFLFTLADRLQR